MRLHVDEKADALYFRLDDTKVVESDEVAPGIILDYNEQNQVVGIEILHLSQRTPTINLREIQFRAA